MMRPASDVNTSERTVKKISKYTKGKALFKRTFQAHGGDSIAQLNDVNLSIKGHWGLIPARVMPKVADQYFRVTSEEHFMPNKGVYAAFYNGPAGTKKVVRTPNSIEILYNNQISKDNEALQATAMTA